MHVGRFGIENKSPHQASQEERCRAWGCIGGVAFLALLFSAKIASALIPAD